MTDTREARIARIDQAISDCRLRYLTATFNEHTTAAAREQREVNRLLDLRNRVQRGWPKTLTQP